MRYWMDTEFMEDGKTIELLSIGIVAEDGREYYGVSADADWDRANDWVKTHVLPQLNWIEHGRTRQQLHNDIVAFMDIESYGKPEIWAYYSDYDWVALCQLFGRMVDLPEGWPMMCLDVKQWCFHLGNPKLPAQRNTEHHALHDARWTKGAWQFLREYHDG